MRTITSTLSAALALSAVVACSGAPEGVESAPVTEPMRTPATMAEAGSAPEAPDAGTTPKAAGDAGLVADAAADPDPEQPAAVDAGPPECPGFTRWPILPGNCLVLQNYDGQILRSPNNPNGGSNFAGGGTPDCSLTNSYVAKCVVLKDVSSTGDKPLVVYLSTDGGTAKLLPFVNGACPVKCL